MLLKNSQYSQKNTCAGPCRPYFTEYLSWLLQHFRGSKYFFQVNLVFIAYRHTGFCSELLWKHHLNFRSSRWNSSVKKVFLGILQISQENTGSFFLIEFQQVCSFIKRRLRHRRFPEEFTKFLGTPNLKTVNDCKRFFSKKNVIHIFWLSIFSA